MADSSDSVSVDIEPISIDSKVHFRFSLCNNFDYDDDAEFYFFLLVFLLWIFHLAALLCRGSLGVKIDACLSLLNAVEFVLHFGIDCAKLEYHENYASLCLCLSFLDLVWRLLGLIVGIFILCG